jgi:hypothetical protein
MYMFTSTLHTFFFPLFLLIWLAQAFQCDTQWPPLSSLFQAPTRTQKCTATSFGTRPHQPLPWPRDAHNAVPFPFCYTNSSAYHATVVYFISAISMTTSALETDEPNHALAFNVLYHKDQYGNDGELIYCDTPDGIWNDQLSYSTVVIQK